MVTFPFSNEKNRHLTRVSEYIYSPIESLDEIIRPLSNSTQIHIMTILIFLKKVSMILVILKIMSTIILKTKQR